MSAVVNSATRLLQITIHQQVKKVKIPNSYADSSGRADPLREPRQQRPIAALNAMSRLAVTVVSKSIRYGAAHGVALVLIKATIGGPAARATGESGRFT
jgi:hypothetical protein